MPAEAEFENVILDNPEDDAVRLVYADWLEERGDVRGEYLHLETRRTPDARARLNELRRTLDADWVRRIGLRRIVTVDDLVYYLRGWMGLPSPARPNGLDGDLPSGLAKIYGGLPELFAAGSFGRQDSLSGPGRLRQVDDMVEFAWENQGNWSCRFPYGQDDPPVFSNAADVWHEPRAGYQKVCDSLNHFLITMCLQEAVMSAPWLAQPSWKQPRPFPRRTLWLSGIYVESVPDHQIFDEPRNDVLIMDWCGVWHAARTEDALLQLDPDITYLRSGAE